MPKRRQTLRRLVFQLWHQRNDFDQMVVLCDKRDPVRHPGAFGVAKHTLAREGLCTQRRRLFTAVPRFGLRGMLPTTPTQGTSALDNQVNQVWNVKLGAACNYETRERDCGTQLVCLSLSTDVHGWHPPNEGVCGECTKTAQCDVAPEQICREEYGYYICAHKPLDPPDLRDYLGFLMAFLASAIAAGGGIGGGGLMVPLFVLVLAFTPHDATPLSNVTILGGALANLLLNARRSHPADAATPLISFEVALMMEPTTIAGALIGVVLNKIFPGWLITTMLVVLLGMTARRTITKGVAAWRKESAAAALPPAASEPLMSPYTAAAAANGETTATATPTTQALSAFVDEALGRMTPSKLLDEASRRVSTLLSGAPRVAPAAESSDARAAAAAAADDGKGNGSGGGRSGDVASAEARARAFDVGVLVCVLAACFVLAVLRGRSKHDSLLRVGCGSAGYWGLIACQFCVAGGAALCVRRLLMRRHEARLARGYAFKPDDVLWTPRNTLVYPLTCTCAGLCAGMFGIGGGIIKGPLMLEMGLHPQVSSATAAYMILFTSSAATFECASLATSHPLPGGHAPPCRCSSTPPPLHPPLSPQVRHLRRAAAALRRRAARRRLRRHAVR